jgi:hypothetical protein
MFCTKDDIYLAIQNNDKKIKNYFDIFGFVVIKGMISKSEYLRLATEYDKQYKVRFSGLTRRERIKNIFPTGFYVGGIARLVKEFSQREGMRFLPNFIDSSKEFTEYFFKEEMQKIYRYFAGEDFLYLGSDGSHFITTSFPWHKDWYTKNPIIKINYYFSDLPFFGGRFMLIPGSNIAGDAYAGLLQNTMSWPMQNKFPNGLNENSFLPRCENPREGYLAAKWRSFKNYVTGKSDAMPVPHVSVKLNKGDIVIFDQRLIHCVESNFPIISRRLLTVLLSKNAFEFSDEHYLIKAGNKREDLMREIVDLAVSERNHIKIDPYGSAIYDHPISKSHHFVEMTKIDDVNSKVEERVNFGRFACSEKVYKKFGIKEFSSRLDSEHYAEIGRKFRQEHEGSAKSREDVYAESYTYGDTHLGINAQNIEKTSNI